LSYLSDEVGTYSGHTSSLVLSSRSSSRFASSLAVPSSGCWGLTLAVALVLPHVLPLTNRWALLALDFFKLVVLELLDYLSRAPVPVLVDYVEHGLLLPAVLFVAAPDHTPPPQVLACSTLFFFYALCKIQHIVRR